MTPGLSEVSGCLWSLYCSFWLPELCSFSANTAHFFVPHCASAQLPNPVSLNNLPMVGHSKEQGSVFSGRLLRVRPEEYQERLNGIAETQGHWNGPQPGSQCTLILFGFYCACCILDSQHLLRADFPDTSFQEVSRISGQYLAVF